MEQFIEAMLIGLGNGSTIALIAIGFVVIYKSTQVVNFAQPALMILGGYLVSVFAFSRGMSFYTSVLLAVLATVVVGVIIERATMRPMVGEPVFVLAIITVGVDIVVRSILNRQIGGFVRQVNDPWGLEQVQFGNISVQQRYLAMMGVTAVVVLLLLAFFKYSRLGLALRATAFDQEVALTQGVSVGAMFALSWAIAGALAALGGAFVGTGNGIDQTSFIVAFKALPAIILGGLDSIGGAVIGGLAVGVVEALAATYVGSQPGQCCAWLGNNFSSISPFVLMLVVLLIKPYGLFGTPEIERV